MIHTQLGKNIYNISKLTLEFNIGSLYLYTP